MLSANERKFVKDDRLRDHFDRLKTRIESMSEMENISTDNTAYITFQLKTPIGRFRKIFWFKEVNGILDCEVHFPKKHECLKDELLNKYKHNHKFRMLTDDRNNRYRFAMEIDEFSPEGVDIFCDIMEDSLKMLDEVQ